MAKQDTQVDVKALMGAIAKGWKLVNTPKVRAGFKPGQQRLVQSKDGKTLGMLTLREGRGVRVEGSRLARNITVTDEKGVEEARSLLEVVNSENINKLAERANRQTAMTAKRVEAAKAKQAGGSGETKPSGRRARSRATAVRGETVA